MNRTKEITIYDIAKELNVSPSTVSRALRDHRNIAEETKKIIKKYVSEKGYRPNSLAATLRSKKRTNIGVIVSWINRPFVSSLISGIEMEANLAGYNVIISQSQDEFEREVANTEALFDGRVGGLVVSLAMNSKGYKHFQQFIDNNIPLVFVDRVAENLGCDLVVIDNYAAAYSATHHLIEQGCARIAYIGGKPNIKVYKDRQKGYLQALQDHGLPIDKDLILERNTLSSAEGTKAAEYLLNLSSPPDGIFSTNDTVAVSVIQYAKSKGINIPQELAVIGFNNDPIGLIVEPTLSTITHPGTEMGRVAAQQILWRNDKKKNETPSTTIVLNTQVVVRDSSRRI